MTTINSANEREIKDLIIMRGGKPRSKRADKLILMEILEVDLIWLRETKEINVNTLISEVNEISVREFSRWCRERALLEDTIKKLIEGGIQKVTHFRDLNRKVLERNKIMPAQIEVIMGVIGREFQQGQKRRENHEKNFYKMSFSKNWYFNLYLI